MLREDAAEGEARSRMLPRGHCLGLGFFPGQLGGDQPGLFLVLQPVAFALDVDRGRVVQQAVEYGRSDDVVGEDGSPVAIALVRGQDDRVFEVRMIEPFSYRSETSWNRQVAAKESSVR